MPATATNLSPAQKAWVTRRAMQAASATVTVPAVAAPVSRIIQLKPVAAPVADEPLVNLWVDDPAVGCGLRLFVVVDRGDRFVSLMTPSLATIRVERKYFDRYAKPATRGVRRSRVAEIIRRNVAFADRVNAGAGRDVLSDGGAFLSTALRLVG